MFLFLNKILKKNENPRKKRKKNVKKLNYGKMCQKKILENKHFQNLYIKRKNIYSQQSNEN